MKLIIIMSTSTGIQKRKGMMCSPESGKAGACIEVATPPDPLPKLHREGFH